MTCRSVSLLVPPVSRQSHAFDAQNCDMFLNCRVLCDRTTAATRCLRGCAGFILKPDPDERGFSSAYRDGLFDGH